MAKAAEILGITPQLKAIESQKQKFAKARKVYAKSKENLNGVCYRCLWIGHYGDSTYCLVQEGTEQQQNSDPQPNDSFDYCQHCGNGTHATRDCLFHVV